MKSNKILWVHNFDTKFMNSGIFMFNFYKYLLKKGVKIDLYYAGNMMSFINLLKQLIAIRKKAKKYDVVHVQFGSMLGFLVRFSLIGLNLNKVITIRGSDFYRNKISGKARYLHSFFAVLFTKNSIRSYDKVIVVSERMKKEIIAKFSLYPRKIEVHPTPINVDDFDIKNSKKKKRVKKVIFGTVNINSGLKRYSLAMDAVNIAIKNSQSKYKIEIVVAEKIIHSKMKDLYNSADLLPLTSVYEGWPNVVKEALSCGVPFVTTDISDMKLLAKKSNGICKISRPDKFELAKKIEDSLSNSLSLKNREMLRSLIMDMSLENSMKKIIPLYSSFKN